MLWIDPRVHEIKITDAILCQLYRTDIHYLHQMGLDEFVVGVIRNGKLILNGKYHNPRDVRAVSPIIPVVSDFEHKVIKAKIEFDLESGLWSAVSKVFKNGSYTVYSMAKAESITKLEIEFRRAAERQHAEREKLRMFFSSGDVFKI